MENYEDLYDLWPISNERDKDDMIETFYEPKWRESRTDLDFVEWMTEINPMWDWWPISQEHRDNKAYALCNTYWEEWKQSGTSDDYVEWLRNYE